MLCYSTGSLPDSVTQGDSPAAIADRLAYWLLPTPFRGVEWVIRPEHLRLASDQAWWRGLRRSLEARGLLVRNVHLGFPRLLSATPHRPGLSSLLPQGRALRREAALTASRLAEILGSPHVTLTSGLPERAGGATVALPPEDPFARSLPPFAAGALSPDFAEQERVFHSELAWLVAQRPRRVAVLLEQEPEMVVHAAGQMLALSRAFEGDVFANYDVGHGAVLGENIAQALRDLGPYLRNVHLEDIRDGVHRHLLFGAGDVDFSAIFHALKAMEYAGDLTPDLYPYCDRPLQGLRESNEFLAGYGYLPP